MSSSSPSSSSYPSSSTSPVVIDNDDKPSLLSLPPSAFLFFVCPYLDPSDLLSLRAIGKRSHALFHNENGSYLHVLVLVVCSYEMIFALAVTIQERLLQITIPLGQFSLTYVFVCVCVYCCDIYITPIIYIYLGIFFVTPTTT